MKKIFEFLFGYWNDKYSADRLHIKDVKAGQNIYIETGRAADGIAHAKCLNNDPYSKKIIVMVRWKNEVGHITQERLIIEYNHNSIKNFHLLNSKSVDLIDDVSDLKKKLEIALENEDYLLAEEIKKKLNDIEKK